MMKESSAVVLFSHLREIEKSCTIHFIVLRIYFHIRNQQVFKKFIVLYYFRLLKNKSLDGKAFHNTQHNNKYHAKKKTQEWKGMAHKNNYDCVLSLVHETTAYQVSTENNILAGVKNDMNLFGIRSFGVVGVDFS